jgi:hypothetical protein
MDRDPRDKGVVDRSIKDAGCRCGLSSSARSESSALKSKVASGSEAWGRAVVISLWSDPSSGNGGGDMSASSTTIALSQPSALVGDNASWSSADNLERERSSLEVLGEG